MDRKRKTTPPLVRCSGAGKKWCAYRVCIHVCIHARAHPSPRYDHCTKPGTCYGNDDRPHPVRCVAVKKRGAK